MIDFENTNVETPLAAVLSLSLHRLQRAPRAIHRAFLSRPSIFKKDRTISGAYLADGFSFLKDSTSIETCLSQMIAQAQRSVLLVGRVDASTEKLVERFSEERPDVRVRRVRSSLQFVLTDERVGLLGGGELRVCVEGEIARKLGDLFQLSLRRQELPRGRTNWPVRTRLDLESIEVGLARTWISPDSAPVIEIERMTLAALRSAKRFVYIEASALTSPVLVNAIVSRVRRDECPEFLIVLPSRSGAASFLERAALAKIVKADANDRVRIFERPFETRADAHGCGLWIVDDQFVKIGTSTLSSRSFGNSQEVDLAIEAVGRPQVVMAIARLRRERLGHLLGLEPSEFDARFLLNGSLNATFESFFTALRLFPELTPEATPLTQIAFSLSPLLDPKRPRAFQRWVRRKLFWGPKTWRFAFIFIMIFALLITFASLFAPLGL